MDKGILISIAIPTYNRYQYLEGCLKATCTIPSNKIEIVVQDNSEDNYIGLELVRSINDDRIKYYHTREHVTVSDNCSYAVENTRGKYVCLIGDDDTVCNNIVELVEEMDKKNIDTCVFGITTYHWPDLLEQKPDLICFEGIECKGIITYKDPMGILHEGLKNGLQSIRDLPRAYHAIASKKVLEEIKNATGTYFPGPSPDMANAVGCMLFSKSHISIDQTIMVSGYGGKSGGGMGRKHEHKGSLLNKPWLPKNILEIWDPKIPQLWLGHTIWPASAVVALKEMGRDDLVKELNYGVIYAEMLLHEKNCLRDILKCKVTFAEWLTILVHVIKRVFRKMFRTNQVKPIIYSKETISLEEAKDILDTINKNNSIVEAFENSER